MFVGLCISSISWAQIPVSVDLEKQLENLINFRLEHRLDTDFYHLFHRTSNVKTEEHLVNIHTNELAKKLIELKDESKSTFTNLIAIDHHGHVIAAAAPFESELLRHKKVWPELAQNKQMYVSDVYYNKESNLLNNRVYIPLFNESFLGYLAISIDAYYLDLVEYFMEQ